MPGLLRIRGSIDLAQFWPDGEADADTTKIKVSVGKNSFSFAADGKAFKSTDAFKGARVVGVSGDTVIDKEGRITVRLQGVDAPELHFRAPPLAKTRSEVTAAKRTAYNAANAKPFRQYLAETPTRALCEKLDGFSSAGKVACVVTSIVDQPFQVIDTYGRFVGNIGVGSGAGTDINVWLAEEGWVLPTFYSSMTEGEIDRLLNAAKKGRKKRNRVWDNLKDTLSGFDAQLLYRKHGEIDAENDIGPVLPPKLFRRQVAYEMEKKAKLKPGAIKAFLAKRPDRCFDTKEFLEQGINTAPEYTLDEYLVGTRFDASPEDIVFKEKYSDLVNSKGKRIETW